MNHHTIKDVEVMEVSGEATWALSEDRQVNALDIYGHDALSQINVSRPESAESAADTRVLEHYYLRIHTDRGVTGITGPIGRDQVFIVLTELKPFLLGRDSLGHALLHDQMLRLHRHGRSGLYVTAISAVDLALWDIAGKVHDVPVYRLLGGPTRDRVDAYASMLGFSTQPERAAATAQEYKQMGFKAQKWFFRHGPGDGEEGLAGNLALAGALREAVGPHYPLMFDAYMGWSEPYASTMIERLAPLHPTWMEEPVPPERVGSLVRLRGRRQVPIATGEHVITRWQVKELLERGAVDILQCDPEWTGGVTEQMAICALASAYNTPVIAHGHTLLPALHVALSQSPETVPCVEYLVRHQKRMQHFFATKYAPEDGGIAAPELPGMGIVLEESAARTAQCVAINDL